MNRDELAALIAQTYPTLCPSGMWFANGTSAASTSRRHSTSPMSPQQQFQRLVRTLGYEDDRQSPTKESPRYYRSPLGQVAGPRGQTQRPAPPCIHRDTSIHSVRPGHEEPAFILEERAVWSRQQGRHGQEQRTLARAPNPHSVAEDVSVVRPAEAGSLAQQPRKGPRSWHSFALTNPSDTNPRPGTIRGPRRSLLGFTADSSTRRHAHTSKEKSRLSGGRMNEPSIRVASSWDGRGEISSDVSAFSDTTSDADADADEDATPRPSRDSRGSNYSDVQDFKAPQTTPATLKQCIAKLGSAFKSTDDLHNGGGGSHPEARRKGLRKSISMFNLNNLGEKMKKFGGSTTDLMPRAQSPPGGKADPAGGPETDIETPNERKHTTEEVHAQQFGLKKRKSEVMTSAPDVEEIPAAERSSASPTKRRRPSSGQYHQAPPALNSAESDVQARSSSRINGHKRPSRKELEKEIQQLRALLKEREGQNPGTTPHYRSISSQPAFEQKLGNDETVGGALRKQRAPPKEDVPPVPPLPGRVVLGNMTNRRNYASDANTVKKITGGGISRPVSMILEEDEGEDENKAHLLSGRVSGGEKQAPKEHWEWPEDVF